MKAKIILVTVLLFTGFPCLVPAAFAVVNGVITAQLAASYDDVLSEYEYLR